MKTAKTLYPNLVAELARNNMSVAGLAVEMGTSRANMYNKMHGKTKFSIDDMKRIRKILIMYGKSEDVSLDHLFGD